MQRATKLFDFRLGRPNMDPPWLGINTSRPKIDPKTNPNGFSQQLFLGDDIWFTIKTNKFRDMIPLETAQKNIIFRKYGQCLLRIIDDKPDVTLFDHLTSLVVMYAWSMQTTTTVIYVFSSACQYMLFSHLHWPPELSWIAW